MSKAILVMDMPERCIDCEEYEEKGDGWLHCRHLNYACQGYEKNPYCPLKPMPEKKNICGKYDSEYYANGGKMPSWKCGWNDCIDAILGK